MNAPIDWNKYRVNKPEMQSAQPPSQQQSPSPSQPENPYAKYMVKPPEKPQESKSIQPQKSPKSFENENDIEREIERNQARLTSRGLETVLGTPGNVLASGMPFGFAGYLLGINPEGILPTSEQLQQFSEKESQGYTKPENEFEKFSDELFSDISAMAVPGSNGYSLMRNIGIPLAGSLIKEGIKFAEGEDKYATGAKLATMIGLDLMAQRSASGGGARKFASSLFDKAEKAVPEGVYTNGKKLEKELSNLRVDLRKGGSSQTTTKALKKIKEIRNKIKQGNGKIEVEELMETRKKINEVIEELGGFDPKFPVKLKKKAVDNLNKVKSKVIESLYEYGEKQNPEFLNHYQPANEAWGAYEQSNKLSKYLKSAFGDKLKSKGAKLLLGLGGLGSYGSIAHFAHPIYTTAGTAVGLTAGAIYQGVKYFNRMKNSPTLRKYYGNILRANAMDKPNLIDRNVQALDRKFQEEEND